jgi:hypothetical protein
MPIDDIGMGLGGGTLIGTVLTYLGIKQRIEKVESEVRFKDTCIEIHKAIDSRLSKIEDKQDRHLETILNELRSR